MTIEAPQRIIERRIFATEFRDVKGSNGRQKWATAVTYGPVDDFGTLWLPSVFNQGLDERMPTILYGHDWYTLDHVLGQGIDYKDTAGGCDVLFEFADPELVPPAARAMALTAGPNPILKDVSVGFDRQEWLKKDDLSDEQREAGAIEAMQRAVMDELSIVVRGAVPGAQMRGRRSWVIDGTVVTEPPGESQIEPVATGVKGVRVNINGAMVDVDLVVALAKRKAAGDLSFDEAKGTLELALSIGDGGRVAPAGEQRTAPVVADEVLRQRRVGQAEERIAGLFSSTQSQMLREELDERFQPGPDRYIWIVDFSDDQVIFEKYGFDDSGLFMLAYTYANDEVTLDPGDEVEVTAVTSYVPDVDAGEGGQLAAAEGEQRAAPSDADIDAALSKAGRR